MYTKQALRELGMTAIEIMPVAQFPGNRNWGYDGVHLFAPQNSYGGPHGLQRLVDACHAAGYSHAGRERHGGRHAARAPRDSRRRRNGALAPQCPGH